MKMTRAIVVVSKEIILIGRKMLKGFVTEEVIQWSGFSVELEPDLRQGSPALPAVYVFQPNVEGGVARWEHLRQRVIEHNIRVMALYYSRISLARLSYLLNLSPLDAERFIGKLVMIPYSCQVWIPLFVCDCFFRPFL